MKVAAQARARVTARASMRIPTTVRLLRKHRGHRTLVFHESIDDAEMICKELCRDGHRATIYHSRIGESVRRDNLRLFRRGVFDVLVCCRALDEGINVPEACVAVIASATASGRQRIQRLGRVLRKVPGKDHAAVYTLYATKEEEARLAEEEAKLLGIASIKWQRTSISNG